jgi:hypothetical protein
MCILDGQYSLCFLLPGTNEEMEDMYHLDIEMTSPKGKTYIGQVQADCFYQVNILDRQTNPNFN